MPQYRADVWLGSASGRQEVVVNANTGYGAKEQIMNIYGVRENDIRNLYQVRGGGSSSASSSGNFGSLVLLGLVVLFIGHCVPDKTNDNTAPSTQTEQVRTSQ